MASNRFTDQGIHIREMHDGFPLLKSTIDLNQMRANAVKRNSSSGLQVEEMVSECKRYRKSEIQNNGDSVVSHETHRLGDSTRRQHKSASWKSDMRWKTLLEERAQARTCWMQIVMSSQHCMRITSSSTGVSMVQLQQWSMNARAFFKMNGAQESGHQQLNARI